MENRISFRNKDFCSPDMAMQKRFPPNQELCSPKFTRKRLEPSNIYVRKSEKVPEPSQHLTYISPKKYLDQQHSTTDSVRSFTSINNFSRCDKLRESAVCQNQTERDSISTTSISDLKAPDMRIFETAEEIRSKVRANQELNQIKLANEGLHKKVNELNQKIRGLRDENNYLYRKIQGFNEIIGEKNEIINQFSQMLRDKEQSLFHFQNEILHFKRKSEQQQSVIAILNKSLEESSLKCMNVADETDDGSKELSNELIEQYKHQIEELNSKLKYSEIESAMYKKLRYDLNLQMEKNETMKQQNKKLIARIEYLVAHGGKENGIARGRESCLKVSRSRRESEISLQLSPQR